MKVCFNQGVVGLRFAYEPRLVYDLPDDVAKSFIRQGVAAKVVPDDLPQNGEESAAMAAAPERAVSRKKRPRTKRRA